MRLNLSADNAARNIQSCICPMALFGSEIAYVGKRHFQKFRSSAAASLVKKTHITSAFLAMTAITHRVDDPFVYAVWSALSFWKRLISTDESCVEVYLNVLVNSSDNPNHAHDPAAALKCCLQPVHWSFSEDGAIIDHLEAFSISFP